MKQKEIGDRGLDEAKLACDALQKHYREIRHIGYYDFFGKITYDRQRDNLQPLEGTEEMHILNGNVATTLGNWKRSDFLLGRLDGIIMIREKITVLMVPRYTTDSYFLAVFNKNTPVSDIEKVRSRIITVRDKLDR